MGGARGHRARPLEWMVEKLIFLVSLSAILLVLLIFLFVGGEALPVFLGKTNSAAVRRVIPAAELDRMSPKEIREYLDLTEKEYTEFDNETIRLLMEVREEAAEGGTEDKDARINTAEWRYMIRPYQWSGYDRPVYIWQPVGEIHKYNIVPLVVGSLKVSLFALVLSLPVAIGAALYVSQLARPRWREVLKPALELLAGIPSVVLGFFALIVLASVLQRVFGYGTRLNAFLAGVALSLAVIPLVFSIAEDALSSVPSAYTQAALALGASKAQAAWQIVLPAALPGVFAAAVLGFGRALGETMIVLMVSSASVMSWSLFDPARPITATIAAEMAEAVYGGHHYRILFMLGTVLFTFTFFLNVAGGVVIHRLKARVEGKA